MRRRRPLLIESLERRALLTTVPAPVGSWTFDEGTGSTANDSSGGAHNGSLRAGASWTGGNVGTNAVAVNGSSTGYVSIGNRIVDTANSFSVSAWVKLNTLGGFQTFVSNAGASVSGYFLQLRGDTGTFGFARLNSDATGAGTFASATTTPVTNQWYHLVGVNDTTAGLLRLYVDGQQVGTTPYTSGWTANGNTYVGQGFYGGSRVDYVNGAIDDVKIFNVALDADQVQALDYNAAYPLNENAGATSADDSGHGFTMTLNSGAAWTPGHVGAGALVLNNSATGNATNANPVVNTQQPFSVSAWVKMNSTGTTQTFASIDGTNTSGFYLQYRSATGKFAFTRLASDSTSAAAYRAESTSTPAAGSWYHLLGVSDPANSRVLLYVNGILQSTTTATTAWRALGTTVIGGGKSGGARSDFVNGSVDDVRFFNAAINANAAAWLPYLGTSTQNVININTAGAGITVSPDLFGLFMEDINYGGEGGVYNDLVRNSGFNDSSSYLRAWSALTSAGVVATLSSDGSTGPTTALARSGMLAVTSGVGGSNRVGVANSGYFGVGVKPSTTYKIEFYAKASAGFTGPLTVALESNAGVIHASATVTGVTTSWKKFTATITTGANVVASTDNRFTITTSSASANGATLWFGSAHCFPPSYNNSPAHLRVDLMEMLAAMKPAIFRIPGGNYLEGNVYADRFNWSQTIGPIENRPGHFNSAWGYWSTDGMGLDEYLQMAELVGSRPIVGVFAGYTLNGTSSTGTQLDADVQDAVNELHYILDPVTTSWGALRAANGHPAPYDVREVEIGNEDWFSSTYATRYPLFYNAIHAAFPSLQIIASHTATGGSPYDLIDEHYYWSPSAMQNAQNRFDTYSRTGPKVFVGEWASMTGAPTNDLQASLGDITWLLGMMDNSDVVTMQSYAPLWANVNGIQWTPDLIGFDNLNAYGSPSYWMQTMLANAHGTTTVPSTIAGLSSGLRVSVTRTGDQYFLAVVNVSGSAIDSAVSLGGVSSVWPSALVTTIGGSYTTQTNSISEPTNLIPQTYSIADLSNGGSISFPAYSFSIIQLTANNDPIGNFPTVATAAAASPSPVTGTSTALSVLGADAEGEANLTYTWRAIGTPPAPVTFSVNGTNAAKSTTATFTAFGDYRFQVTITDASGRSTVSEVLVSVVAVPQSVVITPSNGRVETNMVVPFEVNAIDQFGNYNDAPLSGVTWSATGGHITANGVFTAPASTGSVTITANVPGYGPRTINVAISSSLRAWYKADAASGATLVDSSTNANNGTLSGTYSYAAGKLNNGLVLSGDAAASLPSGIVSGLNDFTIALWFKLDALDMWSRIFDFGNGTDVNMFLTPMAGGTNALRFAITSGGNGNERRLDGPALQTNVWTHIAITISGNTATMYVNGEAVASSSTFSIHPGDMGVTTQNYLGDSQYPADPFLRGMLDDVRIYGSGLNSGEVATIYDAWRMPGFATSATATPSNVNGTFTNLSALGTSPDGESTLSYEWSVVGTAPGPVTFDLNGTNAAKQTIARFTVPGTYTFQVWVTDANGAAVSSTTSVNVTLPPATVTATSHDWRVIGNTIRYTFSRDVGDQPWLALFHVEPTAGGPWSGPTNAVYDAATRTVAFTMPSLADGDWRGVLAPGTFMAAAANMTFFVLRADFNHDRAINFDDLLVLSQNYGQSGRNYETGDTNGDGIVGFSDLLTLSQRYGTTMAQAGPVTAAKPRTATARKSVASDVVS